MRLQRKCFGLSDAQKKKIKKGALVTAGVGGLIGAVHLIDKYEKKKENEEIEELKRRYSKMTKAEIEQDKWERAERQRIKENRDNAWRDTARMIHYLK